MLRHVGWRTVRGLLQRPQAAASTLGRLLPPPPLPAPTTNPLLARCSSRSLSFLRGAREMCSGAGDQADDDAEPAGRSKYSVPKHLVKVTHSRSSGPGGQNVNKVATAVHMIHKPTGIEVRMQESKSQHQNREKAWQLLRARLFDLHQRQKDAERADARSKMIGSGGRSERVRTYRYKDNLCVDHRLEGRNFNLQNVLAGALDDVVAALIAEDRAQRLAAL